MFLRTSGRMMWNDQVRTQDFEHTPRVANHRILSTRASCGANQEAVSRFLDSWASSHEFFKLQQRLPSSPIPTGQGDQTVVHPRDGGDAHRIHDVKTRLPEFCPCLPERVELELPPGQSRGCKRLKPSLEDLIHEIVPSFPQYSTQQTMPSGHMEKFLNGAHWRGKVGYEQATGLRHPCKFSEERRTILGSEAHYVAESNHPVDSPWLHREPLAGCQDPLDWRKPRPDECPPSCGHKGLTGDVYCHQQASRSSTPPTLLDG